jgi:hypothetical protein
MAGSTSRVRISDMIKRVIMYDVVFTAMMMMKMRAMMKRDRSNRDDAEGGMVIVYLPFNNTKLILFVRERIYGSSPRDRERIQGEDGSPEWVFRVRSGNAGRSIKKTLNGALLMKNREDLRDQE